MPVPATPSRCTRLARSGVTSWRMLPWSSVTSRLSGVGASRGPSLKAERFHHRIVKARPELLEPDVVAPQHGPVGQQRHRELAGTIDPQAGSGEAEVAERARRSVPDELAGAAGTPGGRGVEAETVGAPADRSDRALPQRRGA